MYYLEKEKENNNNCQRSTTKHIIIKVTWIFLFKEITMVVMVMDGIVNHALIPRGIGHFPGKLSLDFTHTSPYLLI